MALAKSALQAALEAAFDIEDGRSPAEAAALIADAIDAYVKTGTVTIPMGTPIATTAGPGTITAPVVASVQ